MNPQQQSAQPEQPAAMKQVNRKARTAQDHYVVGETLCLTRETDGTFWTVVSTWRDKKRCYANVRPATEDEREALVGGRHQRYLRDRAEAQLLQRIRLRGREERGAQAPAGAEQIPIGHNVGLVLLHPGQLVYVRPDVPALFCPRTPDVEQALAELRAVL